VPGLGEEPEARDPERVTLIVRKALSGVARVHGRFGSSSPSSSSTRGRRAAGAHRAHEVQTFGNLKDHPAPWLVALLRRCVGRLVSFAGSIVRSSR